MHTSPSLSHPLLLLLAIVGFITAAGADDKPKKPERVQLEVELERGKDTHRLTIFIVNNTREAFSFETGSRGGTGTLDDRVKDVYGTAPTVIPELVFKLPDGKEVTLKPRAFGGPTRRSMQPAKRTIAAGQRVQYASFAVPAEQVGELVTLQMKLKDGKELRGHDGALTEKN